MKTVSVIVGCYNAEAFLHRCLNSLAAQTLRDMEIILVNDASPDRGIDILREYEAARPELFRVIDLPENRKLGGARNAGMKIATGEYIGFVDADDWVEPEMFERLYARAKETDADCVRCDLSKVSFSDGKRLSRDIRYKRAFHGNPVDEETRRYLLTGEGLWASLLVLRIYRRSLIFQHEIFFPENILFEDFYWRHLWFSYVRTYASIDYIGYFYFFNQDSITNKKDAPRHLDRVSLAGLLLEDCVRRGLRQSAADLLNTVYIKYAYSQTLGSLLTLFDSLPLEETLSLRNEIWNFRPDYWEDALYGEYITTMENLYMRLTDVDPNLAFYFAKLRDKP